MRFTFKFLLSNGKTEYHVFTAAEYRFAREAANFYSKLAFAKNELLDYFLV